MKAVGPRTRKFELVRRFVISALCVLAVLLLCKTTLGKWQQRESARVERERNWIHQASQRLAQAGPPPKELGQPPPYASWIFPRYFIFSKGWAVYDLHSSHAMDGMGDLALLRLSDGRLYFSKLHYCCGISDMMGPLRDGQLPCPTDGEDFLKNCGRRQQWNLISPDGRRICTVLSPQADSPGSTKKALWVSISDRAGTGEAILFERRYMFSGGFLAWRTHWNSSEDLAIEVFNYGSNPMTHSEVDPDLPSNHLASLAFHQDKQTGGFTDEIR